VLLRYLHFGDSIAPLGCVASIWFVAKFSCDTRKRDYIIFCVVRPSLTVVTVVSRSLAASVALSACAHTE